MKNLVSSIVLFFACYLTCLSQENRNYYIPKHDVDYYGVETLNSKIKVLLAIDSATQVIAPFNYLGNQPLTNLVYLEGSQTVNLSSRLYPDSISLYRYSVTVNDHEKLVSNAIPNQILHIYNERSTLAGKADINLGTYAISNKKLKIEMYSTFEPDKVTTVIIYNKPIQEAVLTYASLFTLPDEHRRSSLIQLLTDNSAFKMTDDVGGIGIGIKNTDLNFIYQVYLKHLASGNTVRIGNNWVQDQGLESDPYMHVDVGAFRHSGDYELSIVPELSQKTDAKRFPDRAAVLRFTVQKEATFSGREVGILFGLLGLISGISIAIIRSRSNKRVVREKQEKETSELQLQLVRSQLNPHFLFNALSSIQNLVNRHDTDSANRYLGKFARVTRSILKNQESISLEEEMSLLEDYLEMEKLRFGFNYNIIVDDALKTANVEIPAMLLQPFVENAVKHGVAGLQAAGEINIRFEKKQADLRLTVTDNGSGFITNASHNGLGLELSRKRVELLNKLHQDTPILLQLKSGATGTEVELLLKHWL